MKQPGLINIDVTGLCNKTCNYCPRSEGYPNQKEYMSWKLFRKFVQDLDDYRGIVCFTGRGENSLHPDFGLLVKLLHHPNSCLLYTSPSPRDRTRSRMPSSA